MGGLRLPVMVGESSRQGDVSRELAVLDPPPGDCIGPSSANDMTSDRPDVADSFLVGRRCLDKLGESDDCVFSSGVFFGRAPPKTD